MWKQVASGNVPEGVELIGFDHSWINEDFNPDGLRACFLNDGVWISAFWNDYQDTYQNSNDEPFLYRPMPSSPKDVLTLCPMCNETVNPLAIYEKMKENEVAKSEQIIGSKEMTEPEKIRADYHDRKMY